MSVRVNRFRQPFRHRLLSSVSWPKMLVPMAAAAALGVTLPGPGAEAAQILSGIYTTPITLGTTAPTSTWSSAVPTYVTSAINVPLRSGALYALKATGSWTIANSGTIANYYSVRQVSNAAVYLSGLGGLFVNSGQIISAGIGGITMGTGLAGTSTGVVINTGTILDTGDGGSGIYLRNGGTVINGTALNHTALIGTSTGSNLSDGIFSRTNAPTHVTNYGVIYGFGDAGINLSGGGTITNFGTIGAGNGNSAVIFGANSGGVLIVEPSSVLIGAVDGGVNGQMILDNATFSTTAANLGSVVLEGALVSGRITASSVNQLDGTTTNSGTITGAITINSGELINTNLLAGSSIKLVTGELDNRASVVTTVSLANTGTVGTTMTLNNSGTIATVSTNAVVTSAGPATGDAAFITNSGTIKAATSGTAVVIGVDTTLSNLSNAVIKGATRGIYSSVAATTITNQGTIQGQGGAGITLNNGGFVDNLTGGQIYGSIDGIDMVGSGTIINIGTIKSAGANGVGLNLSNAGSSAATTVTVQNSGKITGAGTGAGINVTSGTAANTLVLYNSGMINSTGNAAAVLVSNGGTIVNLTGGLITSSTLYGVQINGSAAVTNQGIIRSLGNSGLDFAGGGTLTNSGLIAGVQHGFAAVASNGTLMVQNSGTISSTGQAAIFTRTSGTIVNTEQGLLKGANYGVYITGSGTQVLITNAGVIDGAGTGSSVNIGVSFYGPSTLSQTLINSGTIKGATTAVRFGAGNDRLVLQTGYAFQGLIDGAGGTDTVELAAGINHTGVLAGSFTNFEVLQVDAGATFANTGGLGGFGTLIDAGLVTNTGSIGSSVTIVGGGVFQNSGTVISTGANAVQVAASAAATLVNTGTLATSGTSGIGVLFSDANGTFGNTLVNGGTIGGGGGIAVQFGAGDDLLVLQPGAAFTGLVDGGAGNNLLELTATGGTLAGLGTSILNFGTVDVDSGASWTLSGDNTVTNGVTLANAGTLTHDGILLAAGLVTNSGGLTGTGPTGAGLVVATGGTVSNTGVINGTAAGLYVTAASAQITNGGTIAGTGTNGVGIRFATGGNGTIANTGLISGAAAGLYVTAAGAQIVNRGTIAATDAANGVGILFAAGATGVVDNYGTIAAGGTNGTAIRFSGGTNNELIIESGGVLSGIADGANSTSLVLRGTGTLSTAQIINFLSAQFTASSTVDAGTSIENPIIGAGQTGVTVTSSGTLTSAVSVVAGNTLVNSGTIATTAGSFFDGTVANSGTIANSSTLTVTGTVGSTGAGTFINTGTLVNTNTGTITGDTIGVAGMGTVFNSGSITAGGTGVQLATGGTLFNQAGGYIRGGQYGVQVAGALVVNAGTILDDVTAGASLGNGASLSNLATGTIGGNIGVLFTGTGASLTNKGTITGAGGIAVQFDAGANTLTLDTGSVLNGAIDGGSGTGTIILAGTNSLTNTVQRFGAGSTLTVASGADWTARGNWAIANVTNAGTLQPGTAGNPLQITGNFSQLPSGTLRVLLDDASGSGSQLQVTGTAALAGAVAIVPTTTFLTARKYKIVSAMDGVRGTFGTVTGGTALLTPSLSYDPNDAFVTLVQQSLVSPPPPPSSPPVSPPASPPVSPPTSPPASPPVSPPASPPISPPASPPVSPPPSGQTPNQRATAIAVDAAVSVSAPGFAPVLASLDQFETRAQVNKALNQLSGEALTAPASTALQSGTLLTRELLHQGRLAALDSSADPLMAQAAGGGNRLQLASLSSTDGGSDVGAIDKPWGVWLSGFGESGKLAGDGNSHRLTDTAGGGAVGVDYKLTPALRIGAAVGAGSTTFSLDDTNGRGQIDRTFFGLTGSWTSGPVYVASSVSVGFGDGSVERVIRLPGFSAQTKGDVDDTQVVAGLEAGYGFRAGPTGKVTPFVGLTVDHVDQDDMTENGGALALHQKGQDTDSVRSVLGARYDVAIPFGASSVAIDLSAGWAHEYASTARNATVSFLANPGTSFTVQGARAPGDTAQLGVGLATAVFAGTNVFVQYDGDAGGPATNHALTAGFTFRW